MKFEHWLIRQKLTLEKFISMHNMNDLSELIKYCDEKGMKDLNIEEAKDAFEKLRQTATLEERANSTRKTNSKHPKKRNTKRSAVDSNSPGRSNTGTAKGKSARRSSRKRKEDN